MPDTGHLLLAQLVALGVGIFFASAEYIRLKSATKRRAIWALLEGLRMWGFVAITELALWHALRNPEPAVWIACGVLAPIAAALIFNNLNIYLHRKLILERSR